ncbi:MAG: ATP-binding protein [Deltaproteobacteria bacterium]|nr:ATP-binding protein [Deltaproteobacteria bacterium]
MVPALSRIPEARRLVEDFSYFVVHAPRQTGKTTSLAALARQLSAEGGFAALHFSCEAGQAAEDDYPAAEFMVLEAIRREAEAMLAVDMQPPVDWAESVPGQRLLTGLTAWARVCPRPLVLFFDEIDALRGNSLISVLRQLRAGFPSRPAAFPASVVLCGLRDVRDYKAASGGDPSRLGTASPFNIKVKSFRIGNFTAAETAALLAQHTGETGQGFAAEAVAHLFELTRGQPWLVNALAREVIEEMGVAPPEPITAAHVEEAKERLILARATHLDSLVARLNEERVRSVLQPVLAGTTIPHADSYDDDVLYLRDLGLVAPDNPVRVANPIYKEVIVRVLAGHAEGQIFAEPRSFMLPDGRLNMRKLLAEFIGFWKEHGEVLAGTHLWQEAAAQLVLMAFLQRIVNGGGYVDREYGVGRGRIDLLVKWPLPIGDCGLGIADCRAGAPSAESPTAGGEKHRPVPPFGPRQWQREALELKVWTDGRPDPLAKGLEQIDAYLSSLSLDEGYLVLFDRRTTAAPVEERCSLLDTTTASGRKVLVVRA